jgi:excisionase family DNA binding protein
MARKDFREIQIGGLTLLSTSEAADRLQISKPTVRSLIKQGKIQARKVGGKFYISEDSLKEFFLGSSKEEGR